MDSSPDDRFDFDEKIFECMAKSNLYPEEIAICLITAAEAILDGLHPEKSTTLIRRCMDQIDRIKKEDND